jgi:hypothetical protein
MEHLRGQTAGHRLEIVIVAVSGAARSARPRAGRLCQVDIVGLARSHRRPAHAPGMRRQRAGGRLGDHSFPGGLGEALISASGTVVGGGAGCSQRESR